MTPPSCFRVFHLCFYFTAKREILGAESSSDKVCKSENVSGGDVHAGAIDRERHNELNVLEQVRQILATNKCQSTGQQQEKTDESRSALPRRGIYRSKRKNKQLVKNPGNALLNFTFGLPLDFPKAFEIIVNSCNTVVFLH